MQPASRSAPEHDPCRAWSTAPQPDGLSCKLGVDFSEGGKLEGPEKNPQIRLKLIERRMQRSAEVGGVSVTTGPSLLPLRMTVIAAINLAITYIA